MSEPDTERGGSKQVYHSVDFGSKNSWDDWHLIPSSRPVINPPSVKTYQVEIPGGYGSLDLTEVLTGKPMYGNRVGSLEFIVDNGHANWIKIYTDILGYLHGQTLKLALEDDREYYYEGRLTVNEWKSEEHNSTVTIDYDLYPFKKSIHTSGEKWLWDPFNFETGIIRTAVDIRVDGSKSVTLPGSGMPVMPKIYATTDAGSTLSVTVGGNTYALSSGSNMNYNIVLEKDGLTLLFTGNGTVTIDYESGEL